jgi:hypothetical protein
MRQSFVPRLEQLEIRLNPSGPTYPDPTYVPPPPPPPAPDPITVAIKIDPLTVPGTPVVTQPPYPY